MTEIEGHRVLVVEDDADTRTNLCDILELDGFLVSSVGTAEEIFRIEDLNDFTAIILDRRLPDGTADELLPRLRQEAPSTAIIIISNTINFSLRHMKISSILWGNVILVVVQSRVVYRILSKQVPIPLIEMACFLRRQSTLL